MKNIAASLLFFLSISFPCAAQIMNEKEYHHYIKKLNEDADRWIVITSSMNIEQLQASGAVGTELLDANEAVGNNLKVIKKLIKKLIPLQLDHDSLGVDIQVEYALTDIGEMIALLVNALPSNEQGNKWIHVLNGMAEEVSASQMALRKHVWLCAKEMEAKLKKCSP